MLAQELSLLHRVGFGRNAAHLYLSNVLVGFAQAFAPEHFHFALNVGMGVVKAFIVDAFFFSGGKGQVYHYLSPRPSQDYLT